MRNRGGLTDTKKNDAESVRFRGCTEKGERLSQIFIKIVESQ